MAEKLEAAVFDVDGMLLDTREFIFQAFEHTLPLNGYLAPDRAIIAGQIGRTLQGSYEEFAPGADIEALLEIHRQWQSERLHLISPFEGLHDMLQALREGGLALGVFSNRKGHLVPSLESAGITEYFEVIVHGGDVQYSKPHPEGLLAALGKLSVEPTKAAMLGDAAVDIEAGKAAGVALTVGITHGFGTRTELEQSQPDYIVDRLAEIPPLLIA